MIDNKIVKLEDVSKITSGRKIIYSGDTMICPDLFKAAKGIDLLIHDGTFVEKIKEMHNHSCIKDVIRESDKAEVKKLFLTHFSRRYRNSALIRKSVKGFKNVFIAEDMKKVKL